MKIAAIILASGSSTRFGGKIPKPFLCLQKKKLYCHVIDTIISSSYFAEIFLVSKKSYIPFIEDKHKQYVIEGGSSRSQSVHNGLKAISSSDYVMIFDGCRPFQDIELIEKHIEKLKNGSIGVNTLIACEDTINIMQKDYIESIPDREKMYRGQTPQSFKLKQILQAHEKNIEPRTDDCSLLIKYNQKVDFVYGNKKNIKITTAIDLKIAEALAQKN